MSAPRLLSVGTGAQLSFHAQQSLRGGGGMGSCMHGQWLTVLM
jgi:hypothetical protein